MISGQALSQTIDVTQPPYNANGSDMVGDGGAFNLAISNANPGDTILIPNGTYYFAIPVNVNKNNLIITSTGAKLKKFSANANITLIRVIADNVLIENLEIDGSKGNSSTVGGSGIVISGSFNAVRNVKSYANQGHGIGLHGNIPGDEPIEYDPTAYTCSFNKIYQSTVHDNNQVGIPQHTCTDNIITENYTYSNGNEGITVDVYSHRNIVSNNRIINNCNIGGVGGIGVDASDLNTISNNIITAQHNGCGGIKTQNNINYSNFNTITSNVIIENDGPGVWLSTNGSYSSNRITVTSNVIRGNSQNSIKVDTISSDNIITSNILTGVAVQNNGINNIVTNNN
jgi:hypothetical protein